MAGATDRTAQGVLNHITGKSALFALPTVYVALFTAVGTDAGTGFTEAAFTGYARVATSGSTWNAASGSAPSTISNALTITFPNSTSAGSNLIAFGLYDAASAGNLLEWDYLGNFSWLPATFTAASPAVITCPAHGFSNGDNIAIAPEYGSEGSLVAGWTAGLLTVAGVTTDTFTAGVNSPANTGGIVLRKVVQQAVVSNNTISFNAGALVLSQA